MDNLATLGIKVTSDDINQAIKRLDKLEAGAGKAEKATDRLGSRATDVYRNIATNVALATAAFTAMGAAISAISNNIIKTASDFEDYQLRLNAVFGSVEKGNQLFEDMVTFASKVPFAFDEIMASATQLAGVMKGGVDEVNQWMPLIADLAAVSGLGIQQTTEQVVRMYSAGAASADLFRERGITSMLGFQAGVSYSAEQTRDMLISAVGRFSFQV